MAPKDPVHKDQWSHVRDTPPYENAKATVNVERPAVLTNSKVEMTDQGPKITLNAEHAPTTYDVRRMEVQPGKWVKEFTVKVHLDVPPGTPRHVVDNIEKGM